ncbi:MAG: CpsD/CapB family tyrosine-protein kinase [Clostridiales bacterium]|nr:CpsD/CapB family tyrosine-protein kinase [Clostridiales bacterium]
MAKFKPIKTSAFSQQSADEKYPICENISFASSEAYKRLRTNILFSFAGNDGCKVVGVTSSVRGEGKSITAINLSYSMAQDGKKVLLIDADMRLSTVAEKLGISNGSGLSELLTNQSEDNTVVKDVCAKDDICGFDVLTSGSIAPNPSELLGSAKMESIIDAFKECYDYIFIDLPPVCVVTDAAVISKYANGMVIVVRRDVCRTDSLKETVDQLKFAGANILGFVYNGSLNEAGKYGYRKYGRYYARKR